MFFKESVRSRFEKHYALQCVMFHHLFDIVFLHHVKTCRVCKLKLSLRIVGSGRFKINDEESMTSIKCSIEQLSLSPDTQRKDFHFKLKSESFSDHQGLNMTPFLGFHERNNNKQAVLRSDWGTSKTT